MVNANEEKTPHPFDVTAGDHVVKFNVHVDARVQHHVDQAVAGKKKKDKDSHVPDNRFYVTFALGGHEAKTDNFSHENANWTSSHSVTVDANFLLDVHEHPLEFTIWKVNRLVDEDHIRRFVNNKKGKPVPIENTSKPSVDLKQSIAQRLSSLQNLQKRAEQLKRKDSDTSKFHHKSKGSQMVPVKIPSIPDESSQPEFVIPPKTPPAPHHYGSPDKTIFSPENRPPSRPISAKGEKTKVEMMPHHHDSIEKTLLPLKDSRLPRLARTGKIPEDYIAVGTVKIDGTPLFMGERQLKGVLTQTVPGLDRLTINISLDGPFMSETQIKSLNPLCITVIAAENMPEKPLTYDQLRRDYLPAYTVNTVHESPVLSQAKKLTWQSKHLILTGIHDPESLKQYLLHQPLSIEVHDRDRRMLLDGRGSDDPLDPSQQPTIDTSVYGVATLSLADLVLDPFITSFKINSPILPGPPSRSALSYQGCWVESRTTLKVAIELACPLFDDYPAEIMTGSARERLERRLRYRSARKDIVRWSRKNLYTGPITRIVIIVRKDEMKRCVPKILNEVMDMNMMHLGYDPSNAMDRDMFGKVTLSPTERTEVTNLISGYHVMDDDQSFIFVETANDRLKEFLSSDIFDDEPTLHIIAPSLADVGVQGTYPTRTWVDLRPQLRHIHLTSPLSTILKKTSTYKRDDKYPEAFQALQRLSNLLTCRTHIDAEKLNLFLTGPMLTALLQKYGTNVSHRFIIDLLTKEGEIKPSTAMPFPKRRNTIGMGDENASEYDEDDNDEGEGGGKKGKKESGNGKLRRRVDSVMQSALPTPFQRGRLVSRKKRFEKVKLGLVPDDSFAVIPTSSSSELDESDDHYDDDSNGDDDEGHETRKGRKGRTDHRNLAFDIAVREMRRRQPNFITLNKLKFPAPASPSSSLSRLIRSKEIGVHNYSSHTFNTSELQKRALQKKLLRVYPDSVFAMNGYTTTLVDVIEAEKEATKKEKEKWMTKDGFRNVYADCRAW